MSNPNRNRSADDDDATVPWFVKQLIDDEREDNMEWARQAAYGDPGDHFSIVMSRIFLAVDEGRRLDNMELGLDGQQDLLRAELPRRLRSRSPPRQGSLRQVTDGEDVPETAVVPQILDGESRK